MDQRKEILCVASGGGHWIQLLSVTKELSHHNLVFVATTPSFHSDVEGLTFYSVRNFDRGSLTRAFFTVCQLTKIILKERPDVVLSTGAAPGVVAIAVARLCFAKTIWLDSVANAEHSSLSGRWLVA